MKINVYEVTTKSPPWMPMSEAVVFAESKEAAHYPLTTGSDSVWDTVDTCVEVGVLEIEESAWTKMKDQYGCLLHMKQFTE